MRQKNTESITYQEWVTDKKVTPRKCSPIPAPVRRRRPRGRVGNRCQHDPSNPNLTITKPLSKNHPGILKKLTKRLKAYYDRPRATIPSLTFVKVQGTNTERQKIPNSARREACLLLLFAMIRYLDLSRLCVGVPTKHGFRNMDLKLLAKTAGIGLRRAERALHDLKAAKLVTVAEICEEQDDGSYVGFAEVKAINKLLFEMMGLSKQYLAQEREYSTQRNRKKYPNQDPHNLPKFKNLEQSVNTHKPKNYRQRHVIQSNNSPKRRPQSPTGPPTNTNRVTTSPFQPLASLAPNALTPLKNKS